MQPLSVRWVAGPMSVRAQVVLVGENFGDPTLAAWGRMSVRFHRSTCTLLASDCSREQLCDCFVVAHTHTAITVRAPPMIGVNHSVAVVLTGDQVLETRPLLFSYVPRRKPRNPAHFCCLWGGPARRQWQRD